MKSDLSQWDPAMVSSQEDLERKEALVRGISRELGACCERNEPDEDIISDQAKQKAFVGFFGSFRQPFPLESYVQRLVQYSRCSDAAFIAAMVFIRRVQQSHPSLKVTNYSVHRLFITAVVIATKYLDDEIYSNNYYAQVGGLELKEMNELELDMLHLLNFDCSVELGTYSFVEETILLDGFGSEVSRDSIDSQ